MSPRDQHVFSSLGFRIIAVGVLLPWLVIYFSQFSLVGYTYPVTPEAKGSDLNTFLHAATILRMGGNPYRELDSLPKSPINVALVIPLTFLPDFPTAFTFYQLLTLLALIAGISLVAHWAKFGWATAIAVFCVAIFTYPLHLHLDRGQMDAFSILAALAAGYLAYRNWELSALALAVLAVQLKPNALALVAPVLVGSNGKSTFKRAAIFATILVLSFAVTPNLTADYFTDLANRTGWMISGNNGSLYRAIYDFPLGHLLTPLFLVGFVGMVGAALVCLRRRPGNSGILPGFFLVLPLFCAYPTTNFLYCYVFFALLIFFYGPDEQDAQTNRIKWVGCVGLTLALFPVGFFVARYKEPNWFLLAPWGLFLILIANAMIAFRIIRQAQTATVTQPTSASAVTP